MALSDDNIKQIRKKFPEEAVQVRRDYKVAGTGTTKYLTGYKPQYIIERLNDCFGHEGWDFEVLQFGEREAPSSAKDNFKWKIDTWVLGKLTIYSCKHDETAINGPLIRQEMAAKQQFGFGTYNKAMPYGDAMKSAATNSLEKCASLLDIGHEAYKGLVKVPKSHPESANIEEETAAVSKDDSQSKLVKLCKKHDINKAAFKQLVLSVFKEEKNTANLSQEEMDKLSDFLEKNGAPF